MSQSGTSPKTLPVLISVLLALLAGLPLAAQTINGRILGTVRDQAGAVVVGAKVTVTDVQRGVSRNLTTDTAGAYVAADLPPSVYKVHVESPGFRTVDRQNVQIEVASDVVADFTLQPGQATETIVVTEEIPMLNTTSSTLGGTLSNKEINDLPLNGRNYENLLQLRPGIVRYPGGGFSTTSSNGLRAEDNVYTVDGLFNSEPFSGQSIINGAGIAGDSATILPIDAIQEFNLQQNPPAEYGWKPGSIVNVGLKSGTNALHGSAYGFFRATPFDARNYFNTPPFPKTPRNLKQFGGTAGGALIKDKLFFFGAYEGQRYTVGNVGTITTPATVSLGGDPVNSAIDAITALQTAGVPINPAALMISGCTAGPSPSCNGTGLPFNPGTNPAGATQLNYGLPNTVSSDNVVAKMDYHPATMHTISGMYFYGNNNGLVDDDQQLQKKWLTQIHTRAQVVGMNWTWAVNSQTTNEARFGYNRLYQPTFPADHNVAASAYGLNTGVTNPLYGGLPRINIAGFYFPAQQLGGFNWPKVQGPDDRFQFVDHLTYTFGKHNLKFGGEVHRDAFNGAGYGGARGRFKFFGGNATPTSSALEDFFAGDPTVGLLLEGDPTRDIHNWGYASFIQDDWRVRSNLTLNFGLRYEINTVIKEAHDLLGNFDPNAGLVQVGKQIKNPYNPDKYNFAPRAGFAWDPWGNSKTVIRGGAGIMYESINWESFLALNNSLGLSSVPTGALLGPGFTSPGNIAVGLITTGNSWNGPGPIFPTSQLDCSGGCSIMGVYRNLKTPYVANWTLGVQHAFTNSLSLEVAYVGNHGARLVGIHDINSPPPGAGWTPAAIAAGAADGGAEQTARPFNAKFPFLTNIYQMGNIYKSNYNGLQTTLTARNWHGFSWVMGYTYAHALDDVGANWDFGAGSGIPTNNINPQTEYASSDFDMRHRFTASVTYAVPGKKSFAQMLEGWEINSIVSLYSAQPWGPMDAGTDISGTGETLSDRWSFFGNPSDFSSGPVGIPFFAGASNPACASAASSNYGATGMAALGLFGCYAKGNSVMIPPPFTFGNMGRNLFRDSGFKNWDFSIAKNWTITERLRTQFRAEFFNILNHPNFANPFGGQNGWAHNDPSVPGQFGCACGTPDVAASNPVIGSGGSRAMQFGLKFTF